MKDCIAAAVILLAVLFGLPWLTAGDGAADSEDAPPQEPNHNYSAILQ